MLNKQNNYAPAWTDARCAELEILQTLLREVSSINNGSDCLGRIARCIELAKQLNSGSLRDGTESFHRFLCNLAIAERKSNTRLDDTAAAIDAARGAQGESNG